MMTLLSKYSQNIDIDSSYTYEYNTMQYFLTNTICQIADMAITEANDEQRHQVDQNTVLPVVQLEQ